jgi:hypothetical protein
LSIEGLKAKNLDIVREESQFCFIGGKTILAYIAGGKNTSILIKISHVSIFFFAKIDQNMHEHERLVIVK